MSVSIKDASGGGGNSAIGFNMIPKDRNESLEEKESWSGRGSQLY